MGGWAVVCPPPRGGVCVGGFWGGGGGARPPEHPHRGRGEEEVGRGFPKGRPGKGKTFDM